MDKKVTHLDFFNEKAKCYVWNDERFDDLSSMIIEGCFKWCGCGDRDSAMERIHKGLKHINDWHRDDKKITWEEWRDEQKKLFNGWEYVIFYMFDERGITEHGGSVPGWLTNGGHDLLDILDSYYNDLENEKDS